MYSDHTEAVRARLDGKDEMPEPTVICLKVVPNAEPNATGIWRKVVAEARHTNPQKYGADKRQTMWEALCELVGEGEHVVAVQSDLRFDGKPGNWWLPPSNQTV